jgi:hypothetical protein
MLQHLLQVITGMPPCCHISRMPLASKADTDNDSVETVATQVAALTYQSQLTALTAADNSQCQELQLAHLASQQNMMHENMHQLIAGLNAVAFNMSDEGRGVGQFGGQGN